MERLPVTCLVDAKDSLGEGCCWDAGAGVVWWLDIARPSRIHRLHPATGEHRVWYSSLLLTALALRNSDGLILGGEDGVYDFDPATGAITPFAKPEDDRPQNRFNDGACDPQGRLWIGTMHQNIGPGRDPSSCSSPFDGKRSTTKRPRASVNRKYVTFSVEPPRMRSKVPALSS